MQMSVFGVCSVDPSYKFPSLNFLSTQPCLEQSADTCSILSMCHTCDRNRSGIRSSQNNYLTEKEEIEDEEERHMKYLLDYDYRFTKFSPSCRPFRDATIYSWGMQVSLTV